MGEHLCKAPLSGRCMSCFGCAGNNVDNAAFDPRTLYCMGRDLFWILHISRAESFPVCAIFESSSMRLGPRHDEESLARSEHSDSNESRDAMLSTPVRCD